MSQTGDIVLFYDQKSILSRLIDYFGDGDYSHVGMIIKDPSWISVSGTYIIQSGMEPIPDVEDKRKKFGVSMYLFNDVVESYSGTVCYRPLLDAKVDMVKLQEIHTHIHGKPYDLNPIDWFEAIEGKNSGAKTEERFWCSALVSYIYVKLKLLPETYDWTLARPNVFGRYGDRLQLTYGKLGPIIHIK